MGGLFSNCFLSNNTQNPNQPPSDQKTNDPTKTRINETDKAILNIKDGLKKLKTYQDKQELQLKQQKAKVKEHLKDKNKQRALIALKHQRFIEKQQEKTMAQQLSLETMIRNIESTQNDAGVLQAMQQCDQVLTELKKAASIEDFEELYERHQENQERQQFVQEMFGGVMDDKELEDDLAALDAQILEEEIPEAVSTPLIEKEPAAKQQKPQKEEYVSEMQQPLLA